MTKDKLLERISRIFEMGKEDLKAEAVVVSMSDVDDKARYFLNKAIDKRMDEIDLLDVSSALVEDSELDPDAF